MMLAAVLRITLPRGFRSLIRGMTWVGWSTLDGPRTLIVDWSSSDGLDLRHMLRVVQLLTDVQRDRNRAA